MSVYKIPVKKKTNQILSQSVLIEKSHLLNLENNKNKNNNHSSKVSSKTKNNNNKVNPSPISLKLKPNIKDKNEFITSKSYRLSPNQNNIKTKKQTQRSISEKDNRKNSNANSVTKRNSLNQNHLNNFSTSLNESSIISSTHIINNNHSNKGSPNKNLNKNNVHKKISSNNNAFSFSNSPILSSDHKKKKMITINKKIFSPFSSEVNHKITKVKPITQHQKNNSTINEKINDMKSKNLFQSLKSRKFNNTHCSNKNFLKTTSLNTSKNKNILNDSTSSQIQKEKKNPNQHNKINSNRTSSNKKNPNSNRKNSNKKIIHTEKEKEIESKKEKKPSQNTLNNTTNTSFSNINQNTNQNPIIIKKIKCMHDISKTGISGDEKKLNQDTYFIFKNFGNNFSNIYMGVCDGHGYFGHEVSGFIRENLPMNLNHLIKEKNLNIQNDNLTEVIKECFIKENENLLKNQNIDSNLSGSTCASLIYTPSKLIIANIGDSRIILGKKLNNKNWQYEKLTRDHKPIIKEESDRIKEKGGRIKQMKDENGNFVGPLRVYMKDKDIPGLAMTRSFGDYYASIAGTICIPEVSERYFCDDDKFIVIASDGLFEFVSNDDVVNIVKGFYEKEDIVGCCEFLFQEAWRRWIQEEDDTVDDITIIVVFFE